MLPIAAAVRHLPATTVTDEIAMAVGFGRVLSLDDLGVTGAGPWAVMDSEGELLAVYESHRGAAKPSVVIPRERGSGSHR